MTVREPATDLDGRFSSENAEPVPWERVRETLESAEIFWLTTVRPDGRPHVTPLLAVWMEEVLCFCTGEAEQKAHNLAKNPRLILTTGCNTFNAGFDIVVEGAAERMLDPNRLQRLADAYLAKYDWRYTVADGAFAGEEGNRALVFEVTPTTVFGFGKGEPFSQTRYRFLPAS